MRIELRIKTDVRKTLIPEASKLKAVHILSRKVIKRITSLWDKLYSEIFGSIESSIPTNISDFKSLRDNLASKQIKHQGLAEILNFIDAIAIKDEWTSKKKSTTKTQVRTLANYDTRETIPHYIKEVKQKIKENEELIRWKTDWS